jgi:hypothetical protein
VVTTLRSRLERCAAGGPEQRPREVPPPPPQNNPGGPSDLLGAAHRGSWEDMASSGERTCNTPGAGAALRPGRCGARQHGSAKRVATGRSRCKVWWERPSRGRAGGDHARRACVCDTPPRAPGLLRLSRPGADATCPEKRLARPSAARGPSLCVPCALICCCLRERRLRWRPCHGPGD